MIHKTLKDKCEYYRGLTDYRLLPNSHILVMIDGKNFSRLIKNKFEKPFDDWFIDTMNKTAEHLCKNIQNCVGAYVQSDEISLLIKDNSKTSAPFDGRLCKLLSIIPAIATSYFMKNIIKRNFDTKIDIENIPDYVFDAKVWNVPNDNDAFVWFLYRQHDCVRNSKQQFCQTYLSHKQLVGLNTDKQVELCFEKTGNDWNQLTNDKKYGRFLYKTKIVRINQNDEPYFRTIWDIKSFDLNIEENRIFLINNWIERENEKDNI